MRKFLKGLLLGSQQALAMFGATTLVGILTGIPIPMTLFAAGVGTLIFHLVTGGKVPIFLGSSFAFLAAFAMVAPLRASGNPNMYRLPFAFGGVIAAGAVYLLFALAFKLFGKDRVMKLFPPVVCGSMIILIGLILAPVALSMASTNWILAIIAVTVAATCSIFGKGMLKILPIIISVVVTYVAALVFGWASLSGFKGAIVALPTFMLPRFEINAMITFSVVALASILEHIGDVSAVGALTGKNYIENPGLHRTLLGDGLATMAAGAIGGPANTTYSECTGTMALTGQKDPRIMRIAAVIAIVLGCIPFIGFALGSIPTAIVGGISLVLYGMISVVGIRHIVDNRVDFSIPKNMFIAAIMLVSGLGFNAYPLTIPVGTVTIELGGLAMAALLGVFTNLILIKVKDVSSEVK